jgi:hypothetical protein
MNNKPFWKTVSLLTGLSLVLVISVRGVKQPSLAAHAAVPQASAVTVSSPSGAATDIVAEGDDFFTHVLGDPRDMNERLDLRWQVGISNISVADGIWQGNWSASGSVYAHYPGHDTGAANIGPIGTQYPIDTSTYRQLSFRIYSSSSTSYDWSAYPGYLVGGGNSVASDAVTGGQWGTYIHTLSSNWSGSMRGLKFRLIQASSDFRFDWVRLTNPDTSPTFNITWIGAGGGTVDIYCDDDANFGNGTIAQIADNTDNDGSFTWQTAAFPPGDYYIYIEHSSDGSGNGDYSSGPLTIVSAPILDFTAPSMTSGEDYATIVRQDPWDMDSWNDILGAGTWSWTWHHIENVSFDGQMHARVNGPDSFIYPTVDVGNPISTSKYKYLTWRWYVEGDWTDSEDRLTSANGWITRFHYFVEYPYSYTRDMNTLNDIIIWEGWNTYSLDLSEGYLDDAAPGPGPGWTGTKTGLRFDFMEAGTNDFDIHVDYVLLTADPTAQAGGTYDIEWTIQASDRPMTITLKYDSDQNPDNGFAGNIATITPGAGGTSPSGPYFVYLPLVARNYDPDTPTEDAYRWSIPSGLSGSYYIYAEVNDGVNVVEWYSEVPIVISS